MLRLFATFIILTISAQLAAFEAAGIKISIPEGFEGPEIQRIGPGAVAYVFNRAHVGKQTSTLLQVTVWDPGQPFPNLPEETAREITRQYLLQFLDGVKRARTDFSQSDVEFLAISGLTAAASKWEGKFEGHDVHGVMYLVIHDSKIFGLHTQDLTEKGREFTDQARRAFEDAKFAR